MFKRSLPINGFLKTVCLSFVFLALAVSPALAAKYVVDPQHTYIGFSVKHMVISYVKGQFLDFKGGFEFNQDKTALRNAWLTIKTASIETQEKKRDDQLRSMDFFNIPQYPVITYHMTGAKNTGGRQMIVDGKITIRGVTKKVRLEGEYLGTAKDLLGKTRSGFTARGVLNRKDFGLTWNKALEAGGVLVGDKVNLVIEVEGILQE
jgi:polyisoprenoid-binding protein YceI